MQCNYLSMFFLYRLNKIQQTLHIYVFIFNTQWNELYVPCSLHGQNSECVIEMTILSCLRGFQYIHLMHCNPIACVAAQARHEPRMQNDSGSIPDRGFTNIYSASGAQEVLICEGRGLNGQSIRSTISDAIVRNWFWASATRSFPFGLLQQHYWKQLIIDSHKQWYSRFTTEGLLNLEDFTIFLPNKVNIKTRCDPLPKVNDLPLTSAKISIHI